METDGVKGLDSFPYRHRVGEVMTSPVSSIAPEATLAEAIRTMTDRGVSALAILDEQGRGAGIVTEKDALGALAAHGVEAMTHPVRDHMASPVACVSENAFVYLALGRMARLNARHLAATDDRGRVVGMVTSRALLKLRAGESLQLGDMVCAATDAAALAAVRNQLPDLVKRLFAEGVSAAQAAAVISAVYCDMTRRAAQLAEADMAADPAWGPGPDRWTVLVLGSGGRGESLLAPDQDNAVIYEGGADEDRWCAEAAARTTALLDAAGVPYCKGEVMATNAQWRNTPQQWARRIQRWVSHPHPQSLLMVDIFYDFIPVHGDFQLARALRETAMEAARHGVAFLKAMGEQMNDVNPPLGVFGGFRTKNGRVDLKKGGLSPLVRGARVMALQQGVAATSSGERLKAVAEAGVIARTDHRILLEAQEILSRAILTQQMDDIAVGRTPGTRVDPRRFEKNEAMGIKAAVRACDGLKMMVADSFGALGRRREPGGTIRAGE